MGKKYRKYEWLSYDNPMNCPRYYEQWYEDVKAANPQNEEEFDEFMDSNYCELDECNRMYDYDYDTYKVFRRLDGINIAMLKVGLMVALEVFFKENNLYHGDYENGDEFYDAMLAISKEKVSELDKAQDLIMHQFLGDLADERDIIDLLDKYCIAIGVSNPDGCGYGNRTFLTILNYCDTLYDTMFDWDCGYLW